MTKNNNAKKFAIGTVIAGAVGYVGGILTAPKSGKETRKDIKDNAVKIRKEVEDKLKKIHSELDELIAQAKTKLGSASSKTKDEFNGAVKKASSAKEKVRQMISALHEGDAADKDLQTALSNAQRATDHLKKFIKKTDNK